MGWQDRDYHRHDPGVPHAFAPRFGRRSIVFWLLAINIGVLVLDGIIGRMVGMPHDEGPLFRIGYFSASQAIQKLQVWRFFTFQFLHAGMPHLFGNMLGIFFFGPMIEQYLGSARFLRFYLICGFAGAIGYLVLWGTGLVVSAPGIPLVGASAGVFGILIAAAMVAPNAKVLLFFVLPIPIRVLAWLIVGVAAYTVLAKGHVAGSNAGGDAAHLGGALLGFLLIRSPALLNWQPRLFSAAPRGPGRWQRRQQESRRDTAEVDRILTKVKEHGLHSLSRREKKILQKATEKQRRAG